MDYRKLWKDFYGTIPTDSKGRIYEIHHLDGNRNNNDIKNLIAVSIEEHFNIHFKQGDYEAAILIADRLGLTEEELSQLRLKGVSKPLLKCPHCDKVGGRPQMIQWHFDNCPVLGKPKLTRLKYTCHKCNKEVGGKGNLIQHEKSCNGSIKPVKRNKSLVCPHCNFKGKAHSNMERWHFDNCVTLTNIKRTHTEQHKKNLRKPKSKRKL